MEVKYIFGIIKGSEEKLFNSCEVITNEEGYPYTKNFGGWVYTISYRDISAVVSDSQFVEYTTLPQDHVARYLLRHQQMIEKVMENFMIIPMRLGTYAMDEDEVRHILIRGYQIIKDIFNRINSKIEIDVVATWSDINAVLKEVAEEEEIEEFKQALLNKEGGVTVEDQIRIGVMVEKHLDKKREKYALEIQTSLSKVSEDIKVHDLMDDKMVINTAFLIEKSKQKDFEKRVENLNNEFDEKLNFRCIGPLPPYSFSTLEVKKIGFDEIAFAKKKLNLGDVATKEEIEKAHRHQALVSHPDRNQGTLDSQEQFDEVTRAYKLLLEYCLSAEQAGQRKVCSFKEEEFAKNAIIVKPVRY